MSGLDPRVEALQAANRDPWASLSARVEDLAREVARLRRGSHAAFITDTEAAVVTRTSTVAADLGGPSLTLNLDRQRIVEVLAEAELMADASSSPAVQLAVTGFTAEAIMDGAGAAGVWVRKRMSSTDAAGTLALGGLRAFAAGPGAITLTLLYRNIGGLGTASFRNRTIWAGLR